MGTAIVALGSVVAVAGWLSLLLITGFSAAAVGVGLISALVLLGYSGGH